MTLKVRNHRLDEKLKQKLNLYEKLNSLLKHADRFLQLIKRDYPNILNNYLRKLELNFKDLINPNLLPTSAITVSLKFEENSILKHEKESLITLKNAIYTFMKFRNYERSFSDVNDITLNFKDFYRGIFLLEYYMAQTLCETIPRNEALNVVKEYTRGHYSSSFFSPKTEKSLEEFAQKDIDESYKTHQALFYCESGKFFFKVERCLYAEAITDLADKELIYYLECYGDYFNHTQRNENFVLTRTQTLMKGDSCCDFCYHDKRYIEEIYHPSKSEWKNMELKFKL